MIQNYKLAYPTELRQNLLQRWRSLLANQPTWFYSTQIVFPVKPGRFKLISQQGAPMNVLQELGG